jgi:hypothetical protein
MSLACVDNLKVEGEASSGCHFNNQSGNQECLTLALDFEGAS